MTTKRTILTISPYLKGKVEKMAKDCGCSQAEVIRMSILKFDVRPNETILN